MTAANRESDFLLPKTENASKFEEPFGSSKRMGSGTQGLQHFLL